LIHVTVLSPYTNFVLRHVHPEKPVFCFLWLVGLALATVAGVALHWWVEAPVERWRKVRWRRPAPVDTT
jgi:peptidoglycan/LPS O-acetylase OafA/YrhL